MKPQRETDPVILQWYTTDGKRHVRVVPRKVAVKCQVEHPSAKMHTWEMQKGLEGFARIMISQT